MIQSVPNKALRIINFKQSMESSEHLYQKLKTNKLKNNIILNNFLFVFDKLTNNLPDVFEQFVQPLKNSITTTPGGRKNKHTDIWFQLNKN